MAVRNPIEPGARIGYMGRPGPLLARIAASVAVALAAGLMLACGGEEEPDYGGDQSGDGSSDGKQTVEVTAVDFSFKPDKLSSTAAEGFEIVLTNSGNAPHTFTIDELEINTEVAAGAKQTISVSPSESGAFAFYCRFHRDQGMEGTFDISGAVRSTDEAPTETSPPDDPYYGY